MHSSSPPFSVFSEFVFKQCFTRQNLTRCLRTLGKIRWTLTKRWRRQQSTSWNMEEVKKRWYGKPTSYEEVADGTAGVPDRTTELRQLWQQSQVKRKEQERRKGYCAHWTGKKGHCSNAQGCSSEHDPAKRGKGERTQYQKPSLSPDRKPNDTGKHTNTNESTRTTRQVTWVLLLILAQEHFRPKNTRETCESS